MDPAKRCIKLFIFRFYPLANVYKTISLPLWNITFFLGSVDHLLLWPWHSKLIVYHMLIMPYQRLSKVFKGYSSMNHAFSGVNLGGIFQAKQHAGLGFDP